MLLDHNTDVSHDVTNNSFPSTTHLTCDTSIKSYNVKF